MLADTYHCAGGLVRVLARRDRALGIITSDDRGAAAGPKLAEANRSKPAGLAGCGVASRPGTQKLEYS